jgi:mono/diheme cytochrome c family protein
MPRVGLLAASLLLLGACGADGELSPEAARGRQLYLAQCTTCHAMDPAQAGPVGPPVKGASRELLDAKVVRGTYPPDYEPKRPSTVMPPRPDLAAGIGDLAAYLR